MLGNAWLTLSFVVGLRWTSTRTATTRTYPPIPAVPAMPALHPVPGTPASSPDTSTPSKTSTDADTDTDTDTDPDPDPDTDTDTNPPADRCALLALLPTELLFDILGRLAPSDLSSTVRSCHRLHAVGTALLYAHVPLGFYSLSPHPSALPTLRVLQALTNPSLARNAGRDSAVIVVVVVVVVVVLVVVVVVVVAVLVLVAVV